MGQGKASPNSRPAAFSASRHSTATACPTWPARSQPPHARVPKAPPRSHRELAGPVRFAVRERFNDSRMNMIRNMATFCLPPKLNPRDGPGLTQTKDCTTHTGLSV